MFMLANASAPTSCAHHRARYRQVPRPAHSRWTCFPRLSPRRPSCLEATPQPIHRGYLLRRYAPVEKPPSPQAQKPSSGGRYLAPRCGLRDCSRRSCEERGMLRRNRSFLSSRSGSLPSQQAFRCVARSQSSFSVGGGSHAPRARSPGHGGSHSSGVLAILLISRSSITIQATHRPSLIP